MEEADKHDKPNAYTSFNTKIWIADKNSKLLNTQKKKVCMLHIIYMEYNEGNTILDSTQRRANWS